MTFTRADTDTDTDTTLNGHIKRKLLSYKYSGIGHMGVWDQGSWWILKWRL